MIKLYKRDALYYLESNISGRRRRWSLHTGDRIVADRLRRQVELRELGGIELLPKSWNEFHDEFYSWLEPRVRINTICAYRVVTKKFGKLLKDQNIADLQNIAPSAISAFAALRRSDIHSIRKSKMTEGGIRHNLRTLRRLFSYAIECGYISKNPVIGGNLDCISGRTKPFSQAEIDAMLSDRLVAVRPILRAIILVFLHTGLRRSDVMSLRKDAITGERLLLRTRKKDRDVTLYLGGEVRNALDKHFATMNEAQRKSPFVFPTSTGHPNANIYNVLRRVFRRAGIIGGHPHRFRSTFAVRLLSKGATIYDVCKLLGISVKTGEKHYAPYTIELRERAAELVGRLDFVSPGGHP